MSLLTKPLNTMLAVLVALPLGPGGLCCCVIGGACGHVDADSCAPAEAVHSCCCGDLVDAQPASPQTVPGAVACATQHDAAGCNCPKRDDGVVPSVPNEDRLAFTNFVDITGLAEAQTIASVDEAAGGVRAHEVHRPPPKVPLHTTLAVFLC
jgi:hypothetical protein